MKTLKLTILISLVAAGMFLLPRESRAQSNPRTPSMLFDSGYISVTGGASGKNRIRMRVWLEQVTHSDGTKTTALDYDLYSDDRNWLGVWKLATQLYNITWTFKYQSGLCTGGGPKTKSGNISLTGLGSSTGILYDSADFAQFTSVNVTGQRYGGSNGITVNYHNP